jgi:hypothetical protein
MRDATGEVVESGFVIFVVGVTVNIEKDVSVDVMVFLDASRATAIPAAADCRITEDVSSRNAWRSTCVHGMAAMLWSRFI